MSGPTTHIGGWYHPHVDVPPYVPAYRAIPGWVPGMPRPPPPWARGPAQNRGQGGSLSRGRGDYQQAQAHGQNIFSFQPQSDPQQGPFFFGRGGYYGQ